MLTSDVPRVAAWVAEKVGAPKNDAQSAIGWTRDDEITCGVFYEHFTGASITATIAIAPGAVMPKDFLWAIFDYPFNQLNCEKIVALVAENNYRSVHLLGRMGFIREASISDYYPAGEAMIIYTLTRQDCRFLGEPNGTTQ